MMGQHEGQKELFSYQVDLHRRVRADHPLRRVQTMIDFTFARAAVAHTYGDNGNVSVDPAVLLKLMFLLFHENVRSERELVRRLPERLDWLWFLGYGLDEEVPNHSVLSKARARWGGELFEQLFVHTVQQCVEAGLVDGTKVHLDGSLIDADASRDSVVKADAETIARIRAAYGAQERKLDESKPPSARCEANRTLVSTTDPEAPCVSKGPASGTARPRYKHHRMVDDRCGVITAVATTAGDVTEPSQVLPLCTQHEAHTGKEVTAVVADRGYGTVETYCTLIEQGVRPHMPPMQPAGHKSDGLFTKEDFRYDETNDVYVCPVGHHLKPRRFHARRKMTDYVADRKVCAACPLRAECTQSKVGRSVARHWKETELEIALAFARLPEAQADRRRRRHLMEGSFAHAANRHHFKRARWRRLWRQQIQDWLIAAVQNIARLCRAQGAGVGAKRPKTPTVGAVSAASWLLSAQN
ncbi:MAG: IS1182 family transposase [Mycobacterium sp.]